MHVASCSGMAFCLELAAKTLPQFEMQASQVLSAFVPINVVPRAMTTAAMSAKMPRIHTIAARICLGVTFFVFAICP